MNVHTSDHILSPSYVLWKKRKQKRLVLSFEGLNEHTGHGEVAITHSSPTDRPEQPAGRLQPVPPSYNTISFPTAPY